MAEPCARDFLRLLLFLRFCRLRFGLFCGFLEFGRVLLFFRSLNRSSRLLLVKVLLVAIAVNDMPKRLVGTVGWSPACDCAAADFSVELAHH